MSPRNARWVLLGVLAVAFALPVQAQWKWRDKNGQMQYSDLPPPVGTPDADILQRPAPVAPRPAAVAASGASSAPLLTPKTGDPELEAKRKKAEQDEAARKKAEEARNAAARADNCARAQVQLKAIDDGQRLSRINANGEREVLDDKGRAEEAQRMRSLISADCGK